MRKIFYADLRTLALVRFTLGLLVFYDFFRKLSYTHAFYSDEGILPRSVLLGKFHNIWKPSLLFLNGTPTFAIILLVIGMLASLFYSLGIRTKFSNFLMWIILISFHERFAIALNAGDILITLLLFWSFFLPMNALASWDSAFWKEELPEDSRETSIFTFAWISQIFFVYIFTFLYKWHPDWFREGSSIYYALQLESFSTRLGQWLLNFPGLLKFMSISTLWLEGLGPWFLLLPYWNNGFRYAVMLAFMGLHVGIGLTMTVGTFVPCCLIMWLFLLPTHFWEWVAKKIDKIIPDGPYEIFYDKDCGFCLRMVKIIESLFCLKNVKIFSSEVNNDVHKKILEKNSWAGRQKNGELLFSWDNFLEVLKYSPIIGVSKFAYLIPRTMGHFFYQRVAKNRGFFASLLAKIGFSQSWRKPGKFLSLLGLSLVLLAFAYNVDVYSGGQNLPLRGTLKHISLLLRLNQKWNMFAPYPARVEGWFVVDGTFVNGKKWDPWRRKEVDFSRPKNLADEFENNVWRKVLLRLKNDDKKDYRLYFGKYLCRRWNSGPIKKGYRLQTFDIYFMKEVTPPPGQEQTPIQKVKIWGHDCFKKTDWPN